MGAKTGMVVVVVVLSAGIQIVHHNHLCWPDVQCETGSSIVRKKALYSAFCNSMISCNLYACVMPGGCYDILLPPGAVLVMWYSSS